MRKNTSRTRSKWEIAQSELNGSIEYAMRRAGIQTKQELSEKTGIRYRTLCEKFRKPLLWTGKDLIAISIATETVIIIPGGQDPAAFLMPEDNNS